MDTSVVKAVWEWCAYVCDALITLFASDEILHLIQLLAPYVMWVLLGASLLLVADALLKLALRTSEFSLVSLLYFLALPVIIARPCLAWTYKTATDPLDEEPDVPVDAGAFVHLDPFQANPSPSAAEKLEAALVELGVPLGASDQEIKRAYLKHLREHHPRFLRHAPRKTQEMSAEFMARIRQAYEIALGKLPE